MKKILSVFVFTLSVFAAGYLVAQAINSSGTTAHACKSDSSSYCE